MAHFEQGEELLKLLASTPRRLASSSKGLDNAGLRFRPDSEGWSANDILAHLRSCADVWGKSVAAMITQNHPTLRYVSPRTWIRRTDYPEQDFHLSLKAFAGQRKEFLKLLRTLHIKDWSRGATFTATTKRREQTVLSYVERIAQHENEHCEQIEALLR